jgi:hypothetical protein
MTDQFFDEEETSTVAKYETFWGTYRPYGGVTDAELKILERLFAKERAVKAVTEKEGSERHVHWCWVSAQPKKVGNAKAPYYLALKKQWHPQTKAKVALKVKIWYSYDPIKNYMCKDSTYTDIVDTMLEQHAVEKLFPAPDDRRACRAKADPWYEKQRDDFLDQWEEEECPTLRDVNRWFYCRMCDLQIHVIHDPRIYKQKVIALYHLLWYFFYKDEPARISVAAEAAMNGNFPFVTASNRVHPEFLSSEGRCLPRRYSTDSGISLKHPDQG